MLIRTSDNVEVMIGDDRGTRGRVLSVDRVTNKAIVENINRVYKHVRRSQKNPQGGRLSKEMPVPVSNLMVVCEACSQPSRMGTRFQKDGSKERFCKKCSAATGQIAPPKSAHAK